jgi:hypothetical protein
MLNAVESLFVLGASFCLNPLELPVNLCITGAEGQDCVLSVHSVQSVSVVSVPFSLGLFVQG